MEQPLQFRRPIGQGKGRQVEPAARERVAALLADSPRRRDLLIEFLHRIQDSAGYVGAQDIAALAEALRLSQAEVFEVATFYHHFDVRGDGQAPPAPLTVRVCDSLPCEMQGAPALAGQLAAALGPAVRVQRVACVGRCAQAPAAIVHHFPVAPATVAAVVDAVSAGHRECPVPDAQGFDAYRAQGGYGVLASCLNGTRTRASILDSLGQASLRGLGGAGFPTARKWQAVASQPAPRLMAVNIDEGEPGTFKDRFLLEHAPHHVLEGVLLAAWVAGCGEVYLYLRDEYAGVRALLERELAALAARLGPLYAAAPDAQPMPVLHLRRGAGAYVCGEESAMIESIEGKRGAPRLRPPYVAERGLFGRPTLVNNAETLFWSCEILRRGVDAFAREGRRGRFGLRAFSVSGRVRDPGVKLAAAGISARELIDEHCGGMAAGHVLYGYLPGGASGGILPAALADEPLDFDTLAPHGAFIGSAAVIVLSEHDSARLAAANLARFFRDESCGQCTPCRVGTAKAADLLASPRWDVERLGELSQAMRDASICGLGQAAANPADSVVRHFAHELQPGGIRGTR